MKLKHDLVYDMRTRPLICELAEKMMGAIWDSQTSSYKPIYNAKLEITCAGVDLIIDQGGVLVHQHYGEEFDRGDLDFCKDLIEATSAANALADG